MTSDRDHQRQLLEALLFATNETATADQLAEHMPPEADIPALLQEIKEIYTGRGVELMSFNGKWGFQTAADLGHIFDAKMKVEWRVSKVTIETLAIIAYHQPVTRNEIEAIRGVIISKGTLDILLEEGLIRPRGRRQTLGRPVLWATTQAFLERFGLEQLEILPEVQALRAAGLLNSTDKLLKRRVHPSGGLVRDEGEDYIDRIEDAEKDWRAEILEQDDGSDEEPNS